jgi:hypothetical protein
MNDQSWNSYIEKIIKQAQDEGEFDNLEGHGKPLNLQPDDPNDPALSLAHKLLHDQGFQPAWLEQEREIKHQTSAARMALLRAYHWCEAALEQPGADRAWVKGEWRRALDEFQAKLDKINGIILNANLQLPTPLAHRQQPRLQLDDELRRLGIRNW